MQFFFDYGSFILTPLHVLVCLILIAVVLLQTGKGADFASALGGGSSLDCAKGINFVLTNGGTMRDYLGFGKAARAMLPSIGVPTTAGTGSDAQSYALISDSETHAKMACGDPKAAFRIAIAQGS